jgi:AAA domain, putative AbiEii toxin, Type IV TA system
LQRATERGDPIYVAGIEWECEPSQAPLVYWQDVLPLAPLTILFGANDSGKSSTLRVVAERLDALARRSRKGGDCTAIVCFRGDRASFDAVFESLWPERDDAPSGAARWTLDTLAGNPRLFDEVAPEIAQQLAEAPVFALDLITPDDDEPVPEERWQLMLVKSPSHEAEMPSTLTEVLDRLRTPPPWWRTALDDEVDLSRFGPPQSPSHFGILGETGLPLVPRTLLLPAGVDAAFAALEAAVEQAWHSFRAWGAAARLPLPPEGVASPWVGDDGAMDPDRFVLQLAGDLETHSLECLPAFLASSYRLDFDPSSPPREQWATRLNARLSPRAELLRHRSFSRKFPAGQIASGFRLWVELFVWDLVARVEASSASLLLASCEELKPYLDRSGSPVARLEAANRRWLGETVYAPWLCAPAERDWQLQMLASAPRTPRTEAALAACARAVQPRLLLIDEPERHLSASVVKDAAAWLRQQAEDPGVQIVIATHSPAFLACHGDDVRHVHVRRVSDGLVYTSFSPADDDALQRVASEMGLDHGDLFGLAKAIVWVEGPTDRAVLDALCGDEMRRRGVHVAMYGGLGNMRSVLDNPIARLPDLRFVVLVDDLDPAQLALVTTSPECADADASHEMRDTAALLLRARSEDRQLAIVSHGAPDIFLALSDAALADTARRPWPGKDVVLQEAKRRNIPKSKLKGFVAARYGLQVNEARCGYAAKLTSQEGTPGWVEDLLAAADVP